MSIFQPGSKTYSIFHLKCPRCHEGDTFETGSWSFKKSFDMYQRCPKCDLDYFPEPGFYYGSMYVSYAVSVLVMFIPAGIAYFVFDAGFWAMFSLVLGIYISMFPFIFRWARNIWLNIFVTYSPSTHAKYKAEHELHESQVNS